MLDLPEVYLLNEQESLAERSSRLEEAGQRVREASFHWETWSEDDKQSALLDLLKVLSMCV